MGRFAGGRAGRLRVLICKLPGADDELAAGMKLEEKTT